MPNRAFLGTLMVLVCGSAGASDLTLRIAADPAPAGGPTQIKIYSAVPRHITAGAFAIDLEPAIFGEIQGTAVFSAAGDASGFARVSGRHLEAQFESPSGGIGQLPGLPVFVIDVPVLSPSQAVLTLDAVGPAESIYTTAWPPWRDEQGDPYSVRVIAGTFRAGGDLFVDRITPAAGLIPRGVVVTIEGAGFLPSTSAAVDGVSAFARIVDSKRIELVLEGATELTGKRLSVRNPEGEPIERVLGALPPPSSGEMRPLFPQPGYRLAKFAYPSNYKAREAVALYNPTLAPVSVTFFDFEIYVRSFLGGEIVRKKVTIPPGETILTSSLSIRENGTIGGYFFMLADAPLRALAFWSIERFPYPTFGEGAVAPTALSLADPAFYWWGLPATPVAWDWQTGTAAPKFQDVFVLEGITASIPEAARAWVRIEIQADRVRLTPMIGALKPGAYRTSVEISYPMPAELSSLPPPHYTIPVTLNVSTTPPLLPVWRDLYFPLFLQPVPKYPDAPVVQRLQVASEGGPTPFTVSVDAGGDWLSASPATGITPAELVISANPAVLGWQPLSGLITVHSAANAQTIPVEMRQPSQPYFVLPPGGVTKPYGGYTKAYAKGGVLGVSAETETGGNWLLAVQVQRLGMQVDEIQIDADATGLAPGDYRGTVLVKGADPIPVALRVVAPAAELTASPAAILLTAPPGQTARADLELRSAGGGPALLGGGEVRLPGATVRLQLTRSPLPVTYGSFTNPAPVTPAVLSVEASALQPGTYRGAYVNGSLTVPIILTVTPSPESPPILGAVVNAASLEPSPLAAGELISIFGMGIGGGESTQFLIGGRPAALQFISGNQVNALVPDDIGDTGTATVESISNGIRSSPWAMPLAAAAPGIFLVLNSDGSLNSADRPAPRSKPIRIFATGAGKGTFPAKVRIGTTDVPAVRLDGGGVPGLFQFEVVVPETAAAGPTAAVLIVAGFESAPLSISIR